MHTVANRPNLVRRANQVREFPNWDVARMDRSNLVRGANQVRELPKRGAR
jgi:hypothetical protein